MTKATSRPLNVFLCHASSDKPKVRELYERLTADGFDVWLDEKKLLPGQNWRDEIPMAVEAADIVIVCLSRKSISKEGYVQKEIKFALDLADEKPEGTIFIIPAKLVECDMPRRLRSWQWVNLFDKNGYERLKLSLMNRTKHLELNSSTEKPEINDDALHLQNLESNTFNLPPTPVTIQAEQFQPSKPWYYTQWGGIGILAGIVLFIILMIWSSQQIRGYSPSTNAPTSASTGEAALFDIQTTLGPAQTKNATSAHSTATSLPTLVALTPEFPFSIEGQTQTTTNVVQVFLRNGESVFVAADWLVYTNDTSEWDLLTAIKLQDSQSYSFSEIKSLDLGEKPTTYESVVTIVLLNGKSITGKLDYGYTYGALKGLTVGRTFNAPFKDIRQIDFQPSANESIEFVLATIVNSNGEEILAPTELLEACFSTSGVTGLYSYCREGWLTEMGVEAPFPLMKGFEIQEDESSSSSFTLVYTLVDGQTLNSKLDMSESPYLRGMTSLGTFRLGLGGISRVDFHKNNIHVMPLLSTQATITLQDGTVYEVPASLLAYHTYYWIPSFPFPDYQNIYFNELNSLTFQPNENNSTVSITANLLNQQVLTGEMQVIRDYGIVGLDNNGHFVEVALIDLKSIIFKQISTPPSSGQMATIITADGNQIQAPVNSIKLNIGHSSMAGPWYSYDNEFTLTTGTNIPFNAISKFEIGKYDTDIGRYPVVVTMMDGRALSSFFADSLSSPFRVCGLTQMGPFFLDINQVVSVDFNRKDIGDASALSTMASVTLEDGSKFQIPLKWLAYNKWAWTASLPVFTSQSIPFNEIKSIKIKPNAGSLSSVTVTINMLNGQVITNDEMELYGSGKLFGIDIYGTRLDVRFNEVNQIDFSSVSLPLVDIPKALIITTTGEKIYSPVNSIRILRGGVGMAGYTSSYYDEISLTTGINVPLSKVISFEVGKYDSSIHLYPITIYTTNGQVINSFIDFGAGQDFALAGLTDNGPFSLDIGEIKSVDTGR